ncbi:MAG: hypothetical protein LUG26_00590 [Ruminococcus sp.]|nr:hypothetical protein [Ruminococcus sp.]
MSSSTEVSLKESYPVRIGTLLMYCEHFKAVGTKNLAEKTTVSGYTFFSNMNKRALKITFEGRIYDEYFPLRMLLYTDSFMNGDGKCTVEYRGITFTECRVQTFTAKDKGEDYIHASITLVTAESTTQSEEKTDRG